MKEKIIEFIFRHALIDLIWAISFCFVYTLGMYIGSVRYGLGVNNPRLKSWACCSLRSNGCNRLIDDSPSGAAYGCRLQSKRSLLAKSSQILQDDILTCDKISIHLEMT